MKKEIIGILLSLIIGISLVAAPRDTSAYTYGMYKYEIRNKGITITDCSSPRGEITIPDEINGMPVTRIGASAFWGCSNLTGVIIPDSVTNISWGAFSYCESLSKVHMGKNVVSIADDAFSWCSNLEKISIPDGVTSMGSAFWECTSLKEVTIPDSVTGISKYAFLDTAIYNDSSNWENDVLYIGNHLIEAKSTVFGDYEVKPGTMTICDYAFSDCKYLTGISIPDSVIYVGRSAFDSTIIYREPSNWDNDVLYVGNHLIKAKSSLSGDYVVKSGTRTISDGAFEYCGNLESITIPDSVTRIYHNAFSYCSSLKEMTLPFVGSRRGISGTYDAVFGYIFGCNSLDDDQAAGSPATPWEEMYGTLQYYCGVTPEYYYIPDSLKKVTITDETIIPYGAFSNCVNLTDVIIEGKPLEIMDKAFIGHENQWNIIVRSKDVTYPTVFDSSDSPTIYGYEDSTTKTYANKHGLSFIPLDGEQSGTEGETNGEIIADANLVNGKIVLDITTDKPVTDQALHVALYNDSSKLVDYIIVPLNKSYNSFNVVFRDEMNSSFAKVFLWDGLESMTPVSQAKSVTIKR